MQKSFATFLMVAILMSPVLAFAEDASTTPTVETPIVTSAPTGTISAEQQAKTILEAAKAAELAAKEARKKAELLAKEQAKKAYEAKKLAEKTAKEAAKKATAEAKAKARKEAQAKFATCMQTVIENRDNSLIAAIDKNREALKAALITRMTSQKSAILIEDSVARKAALNKTWSDFRTAEKKASTELKNARQASWSKYDTSKTCGEDAKSILTPNDIRWNNSTL